MTECPLKEIGNLLYSVSYLLGYKNNFFLFLQLFHLFMTYKENMVEINCIYQIGDKVVIISLRHIFTARQFQTIYLVAKFEKKKFKI